jgi:hypothetical protein
LFLNLDSTPFAYNLFCFQIVGLNLEVIRMLSNHDSIKRDQLLPPSDHLVGKLGQRLIFSFSFDFLKDMYSEVGSPSIDPVIL